jgi:hypothetical protein
VANFFYRCSPWLQFAGSLRGVKNRFQKFDFGAVAEDVHQQFAVIAERYLQFVAAVFVQAAGLFGMILFVGAPARAGV